ncbi:hypothetical protein M3C36_17595 [Dietzia cinnamea]|uniref:hypothetical protein n=1 Tax=Dietzia TaxID=37914 RepID=UPI000D0936CB|nr:MULTISPECIES: hypothetical protein [Dietzia]AVM66051.1 hypothetical protein C3V38_15955 [Dietzia sp. oral taxon 368]MCT1886962.1 hypothetical protein [Dietzia cinnamea]
MHHDPVTYVTAELKAAVDEAHRIGRRREEGIATPEDDLRARFLEGNLDALDRARRILGTIDTDHRELVVAHLKFALNQSMVQGAPTECLQGFARVINDLDDPHSPIRAAATANPDVP